MQSLFQKLLGLTASEWNQTQREALVDLCLLGMYSDHLVSLAEQDFMVDESPTLKWESGISFEGYLERTIPKIRSIKTDSKAVATLIQNISERLGSDESKQKACHELEHLLSTDGVVKLEEAFLLTVKAAMGI